MYNRVRKTRTIKKLTLNFLSDPGHGWLKVSKKVLKSIEKVEPGFVNRITPYSYERNNDVYLEEDQDAQFVKSKLESLGVNVTVKDKHTNKQSKIRSYNSFKPECL